MLQELPGILANGFYGVHCAAKGSGLHDERYRLEVVVRDGLWLSPAHRFHHETAQPHARALQAMFRMDCCAGGA